MKHKSDGRQAFPIYKTCRCMSLRDYFAAKAMQALVSAPIHEWPELEDKSRSVSASAYELADAMMKERAK